MTVERRSRARHFRAVCATPWRMAEKPEATAHVGAESQCPSAHNTQ
jgi:hypothetical protein